MNSFLQMLERKIGKYCIPRLPLVIVICYAVGFIMNLINPEISGAISLNPYAILHGQIWRLVTWVLIPPPSGNLFFMFIMLYFYYSIGTNLENTWGRFYFNYYIFSGMIFTIIASFIIMGAFAILEPGVFVNNISAVQGYNSFFRSISVGLFSTYYINMSIFLAFAATYPDVRVYLFFVIPVKVKFLGIIYFVIMIYDAVSYAFTGGLIITILELVIIFASLLNFFIFFISTRRGMRRTHSQVKMAREYKRKTENVQAQSRISKHKCAICGRTSDSHPDLQFRFCSKCEGGYEYCQDHLFTHKHITK